MQTELNILKEYILSTNKYFNSGFINVYFDSSASIYLSSEKQDLTPFGIDDRLGNYFYIRSLGNIKYRYSRNQLSICQNSQEVSQEFRLISIVNNGINYKMIECLLNSILTFQTFEIQVNSSNDLIESIIRNEYNYLKKEKINSILMNLGNKKIISIDFLIKTDFYPSKCECKPCNEC